MRTLTVLHGDARMRRPCRRSALRMLSVVAAFGALVSSGLPASEARSERRSMQVYKPKHRTAESLAPIAEVLLPAGSKVIVDPATNTLVIVGDPAAIPAALAVLEDQDRALRTLVIRHRNLRTRELESAGIRVDWSVASGDFRIGNAHFPGGDSGVAVGVGGVARSEQKDFSGMLRILEGSDGAIHTGQMRNLTTIDAYGVQRQLVSAQNGFHVRPTILGDGRVRIEMVPMRAEFVAGGAIDFSQASTVVEVRPGETLALGGIEQTASSSQLGSLAGGARGGDSEVLLLEVTIEGEPGAATGP